MEKKLITDLSKLSNLPEEYLFKLFNISSYIISNAVYESLLESKNITEIDVVFGKLIIKADLKDIKIKFIPNDDLEMDLKNINQGGEPSLKHKLERLISAKLIELYKEIL
jgi:hypothetical protein